VAMSFEINVTSIESGWWLNFGAIVHICKDQSMSKHFEDAIDAKF